MNPAGVQLLAYPSEAAFLADPNHSLRTPPWTPAQWQHLCEQTRREGQQELECDIRRHTGEPFRGYLKMTSFEVEGHALLLVYLSARGRLQQVERELAHSVRRFEAVFANATLGIIVCDQAGRMVSANALAGQLFGYAPAELLGQRIEVLVPDAAGRRHEQLRESYNADPQVRNMGHNRPLAGRRRDGSVFPVEASLSYFHLDEKLYVVAYILDLTTKQAAEQELLTQQRRVTRLNAELEQKVADCMVPADSGLTLGSAFKAYLGEKYHMAASAQRRQPGSLFSKVQKAYKSEPRASVLPPKRWPSGVVVPRQQKPYADLNPPPRDSRRPKQQLLSCFVKRRSSPWMTASTPCKRLFQPCVARLCCAVFTGTA